LASDDFRVYYSCPPASEVHTQRGTISCAAASAERATESREIEIVQLYSQDCRTYFSEWDNELAIKSSTLFRIEPNANYEYSFATGTVRSCWIRMNIVLERLKERQKMIWLSSGIWLAAAMALGLDSTRSSERAEFFPLIEYIDPTFIWLLMCLMVIPIFVPGWIRQRFTLTKIIFKASVGCFASWSVIYFFLSLQLATSLHLDDYAWVLVCAQIGLVLVAFTLSGLFSRLIHRIFGVKNGRN